MTIITDDEWCNKFNELNLLGDVRAFISLAYLVLDQPIRLIALLKRLIAHGVVVKNLGDVLIHFYYYNLCDEGIRSMFYSHLQHDSTLQPLWIAHINTVPCLRLHERPAPYLLNSTSSSCVQYDNIVGSRTDSERVTFVFPPQYVTPLVLPHSVFIDQFTLLRILFGVNMVLPDFIQKIITYKKQTDINVLMSLIHHEQLTTTELLQLTSCLSSTSERNVFLQLLARHYHTAFSDYLQQAIQTPCLLYLLPDMKLTEEQKHELTTISSRVYKKTFTSEVFTGLFKIKRMALVFLSLQTILTTSREEIEEAFSNAIISIATSDNYLAVNLDDSEDADVHNVLQRCSSSLLPYMVSYCHRQLAILHPLAARVDFITFTDAWQANMASLIFLKSLFPSVRYCDYPFTVHELHALYLQQTMQTQCDLGCAMSQLLEHLKAGHLFSQGTETEKEINLKHFKVKALIAIYYMTRNQDIRVKAIKVLDQIFVTVNPDVNWRLQDAWWNVPALEMLLLKNQGQALADYLPFSSENLSSLFELIIKAVESGCIDAVQALFNHPDAKNSIATVFKSVAINRKIIILQKLLTLNGIARPDQATVSETLTAVAAAGKWDVAKMLIALRESNRPSQEAINNAFVSAAMLGECDVIEMLLEPEKGCFPDQETVGKALRSSVSNHKWAVAMKLIALRGSNRPSQEVINYTFVSALVPQIPSVVDMMLERDTACCPDQKTVDRMLFRVTFGPSYSSDIVMKLIALRGDNRPSLVALSAVFLQLDLSDPGLLVMLLELDKGHWPDQAMVSQALIKWACTWRIVKELVSLRGDNRPNQKSINRAFEEAVRHEQNDVIGTLLEENQGHYCPDQATVSEAFCNAASAMKWGIVQHLVTLRGVNRPDQKAINRAFSKVVYFSQCDMIVTFLDLDKDYSPTPESVNLAVSSAVSTGKWCVVKVLIALRRNILTQEVINNTFLAAANAENCDVVGMLLECDNMSCADQETVDRALFSVACCSCEDDVGYSHGYIIKTLIALRGDNSPSQELLNQIFLSAASLGRCDLISIIIELEKTNTYCLTQTLLNEALQDAARGGHREAAKILLRALNATGLNACNQATVHALSEQLLWGKSVCDDAQVATQHGANSRKRPRSPG